ncbi:MAG: 4-vinyl reductase [Rhodospirillaceae bacterium]|nr:4-vinyl reductase [Rhodospirillaceae bacterium]MBT6139433.1 4-vinyl reductase [Rhodospirillaceae bacterium]
MAKPQVPIEVDPETGIWSTDGMPMLYLPRHSFVNNHLEVEAALGREAYAASLYRSGYKSAYTWCEAEAKTHGLSGMTVFHHYMKRMSQRGGGLFDGAGIDPATGLGFVRLEHSCFVLHHGSELSGGTGAETGSKLCYMCAGWFPGALDWVGRDLGWALSSKEVSCAGEGHDHCRFEVTPA